MSEEQLAILALLGAGAAAGGLVLTNRSIESPSVWYRLMWPRDVHDKDVVAFFRQLAGDHRRHGVALEIVASGGRLSYRLGVAKRHGEGIVSALASHLPGLAAEVIDHDVVHAHFSRLAGCH